MSTEETVPRLAVRDLSELVGLVPYLIGFHPGESLVIIVIDGSRVAVTARVDLAAITGPLAVLDLAERLLSRFPDASLWCLAYTDNDIRAWQVLSWCAELRDRLGRVLQVRGDGWRPDRFDAELIRLSVGEAATRAVVLGLTARPARSDVGELLCGPPTAEVEELHNRLRAARIELGRLDERVRDRLAAVAQRNGAGLDAADLIRLAALLDLPGGQVAVLRRLDPTVAAAALELWSRVLRQCPPADQVSVLGMIGVAAWLTGDGALQMICLERIDQLDPSAPIGAVLEEINTTVLPPALWSSRRDDVLAALSSRLATDARLAG